MKSPKFIYIFFLLPLLAACSDYLDQVPNDRITMDEVFQKQDPTEKYLANVYSYVPDESGAWEAIPWTGNVDEIEVAWAKYPIYRINNGNWNAGDAPFDRWSFYYKGIRSASYFIKHIDANAEILAKGGQELIDQYKAEARFLRAYYYFLLMRQYGPVVLIGEDEMAPDASVDAVQLARSPFDECVNYVVGELDQAASILPINPNANTDYGRVTQGACLALKSRVLLYAASPQYNGNVDMVLLKNQDGSALISQIYDKEKWKKAADAAKEVLDMNNYQLHKDVSGDPVKSYRDVHLVAWNKECIFARKSNNLAGWDVHCSLRSAGGWCGIGPTQEMVDAYFMADGKSIYESDVYREDTLIDGVSSMYLNREPRFYASIQYNGMKYKGGKLTTPTTVQLNYSGKDGKKTGGDNYSHTGYLAYKNLSPITNSTSGNAARPYVLFRLAEIYLNYAEALAQYNGSDEDFQTAVIYLNKIRERAGVPQYGLELPIPASKEELIEKIQAERRVELAFESHRWFDVRRWKIVDKIMGNIHGMDVNKDGTDFYKRVVVSNHLWKDSYYWWPIPQIEMDRAKKVVQNPGW